MQLCTNLQHLNWLKQFFFHQPQMQIWFIFSGIFEMDFLKVADASQAYNNPQSSTSHMSSWLQFSSVEDSQAESNFALKYISNERMRVQRCILWYYIESIKMIYTYYYHYSYYVY